FPGYLSLVKEYMQAVEGYDLKGNIRKNLTSLESLSFKNGTGNGSFYKRIQEALSFGQPPSRVFENKPLLSEAYVNYVESGETDFQTYVMEKYKDHILDLSDRFHLFSMPLRKDGLSDGLILAYNNNRKRLEELNQKGESATLVEQIERDNLDQINDMILQIHFRLSLSHSGA
ncbi:MAG: hypothetical protein OXN83_06195, partial [Oligoflexia bacterium]|nr:hypothetical protein [Oligoflexia bacterium]